MIVLIDAGNSRIKWGVRFGGLWQAQGSVDHDGLDLLATQLPNGVRHAVIANVAGEAVARRIGALIEPRTEVVEWLRATEFRCGVANGYADPATLGVDRWAALIGARHRTDGPCLVVMAGTATTVDLLDSAGRFLGGLILPGVQLMLDSLARNTALLGAAGQGKYLAVPTATADAIYAGCLNAQIGAIERMYRRIDTRSGASVVLSGGAAAAIVPQLRMPVDQVQNLVLEGLARIAGD